MTFFKKEIAQKIITSLRSIVYEFVDSDGNFLSKAVMINKGRTNHPQLLLPVQDILKAAPDLKRDFNPSRMLRSMRNEGLPSAEGIIDIELNSSDAIEKFVFTVDKHVFNRIVLLNICDNPNSLIARSSFLDDVHKGTVIVDFRSPPIGSCHSIDSFRQFLYSNFIANICELLGQRVIRLSHIEDRGPNIGIFLAGYNHFGLTNDEMGNNLESLDEVLHVSRQLFRSEPSFSKDVSTLLKKMHCGDSATISVVDSLTKLWMTNLNSIYKRFGIGFTEVLYDSQFYEDICNLSEMLRQKDASICNRKYATSEISYDTYLWDDVDDSLKNSSAYTLARGITAAAKCQDLYQFHQMYSVDNIRTADYYNDIDAILEDMGHNWCKNMKYVVLKEMEYSSVGKKKRISTLLDSLKSSILKELRYSVFYNSDKDIDGIAESLSVTSLLVDNVKHRRNNFCRFDFNRPLSLGDNMGVRFQMCYAALNELIGDSGRSFLEKMLFNPKHLDLSPLSEPEALQLVQHLARFDEAVMKAYKYLEPYHISQFALFLCIFAENARNKLELDHKNYPLRVNKARLVLFHATQIVLGNCLTLLGVKPLEAFR